MDEEQQETTDNNLPRLNRPGSGRERPTNRTLNRLEETARRVYNFVDSQRSENREPSLAGGLARVFGDYRTTSRPAKKSKRVKGRPTEVVSIKVTCLSTNTTTRTSRLDINRLKRMGLGYPDGEITMTNRYPSKFPVTWTAEDLRDFFMNSFQALRGVEYDLLYAHNGIFYTIPDLVDTPVKIKQYFTELDKKTISIFIRPREDITARCMEDTSDSDNEVVMDRNVGSYAGENDVTLPLSVTESPEERLTMLLTMLSSRIIRDGKKNVVNVDREEVLDGGLRAFHRTKFDEWAPLSVKFSAEQGIDNGGLSREFLQLALSEIKKLSIFDGPLEARNLVHSYQALDEKRYRDCGKILAYSLVHGGPAPMFFSKTMYNAIVFKPENVQTSMAEITDYEIKGHLQKIEESTDDASYEGAVEKISDIANMAGCTHLCLNYSKKKELVQRVCHFVVLGRNSLALTQFCEGLETCSVLETIKANPKVFEKLFVNCEAAKLDAVKVEAVFKIKDESWSRAGSNRWKKEKKVLVFWRDFLLDLEDEDKLEKLMVFALGLENIPPLGVSPEPSMEFGHTEDSINPLTAEFPFANSCGNILRLPVLDNYSKFKSNMLAAINVAVFTDE